MLSTGDANRMLRNDPSSASAMHDAYFDADVREAARRFTQSAEFAATLRWLQPHRPVCGAAVIDLGAGNGIASLAFATSGARKVIAVEPSSDVDFGYPAIAGACIGHPVALVSAVGEALPIRDATVDIVYARQMLHHASDLNQLLREVGRVLRPGGIFLGVREHVVASDEERRQFLARHPVHRLAGGENAFRLDEYTGAIRAAGLVIRRIAGPGDTIINAYPTFRTEAELHAGWVISLERRIGPAARLVARIPAGIAALRTFLPHAGNGALYAFLAMKPRR